MRGYSGALAVLPKNILGRMFGTGGLFAMSRTLLPCDRLAAAEARSCGRRRIWKAARERVRVGCKRSDYLCATRSSHGCRTCRDPSPIRGGTEQVAGCVPDKVQRTPLRVAEKCPLRPPAELQKLDFYRRLHNAMDSYDSVTPLLPFRNEAELSGKLRHAIADRIAAIQRARLRADFEDCYHTAACTAL